MRSDSENSRSGLSAVDLTEQTRLISRWRKNLSSCLHCLPHQEPLVRFMVNTDLKSEIHQVSSSNLSNTYHGKQQEEIKNWVRRTLDENPTFGKSSLHLLHRA